MSAIVFYHSPCTDGFGAAFAAWLVFGDAAQYVPCQYGDGNNVPDVIGKLVYILDYHFDLEVMVRIEQQAKELILLDHHATAKKRLHGFTCRCGQITFDLERSGAMMSWQHFHPGVAPPAMFEFIQDRDLWKWERNQTADFMCALDVLPFDFRKWKEVLSFGTDEVQAFIQEGRAMNKKMQCLCDEIAAKAVPVTLLGHHGLAINTNTLFSSDVGSRLANKCETFGLCWSLESSGLIKVSLRGNKGFNALAIAEVFGGGGHPQACSFRIPLNLLGSLLDGTISAPT
jgi:oligoribonuclease NrnB/cAMP/cGMP phosphodiesterase (DHH superfamily)